MVRRSAAGAVRGARAVDATRALGASAVEHGGHLLSGVAASGKVERREQAKGVTEPGVGELVADPAAFGSRGDQPALAQTGQVVREVGARCAELMGEVGGIGGTLHQHHQHPASSGVSEGPSDSAEKTQVDVSVGRHESHEAMIQRSLYVDR